MIKIIGLIVMLCIATFQLGVERGENKRTKGKSINQLTDIELGKLKNAVDSEYRKRSENKPFQEFEKENKI